MTTKPSKDTIYLEADDEITVIIDRVISSKSKVVALVLPKRASVFQSAVNMKLLKKSSDEAKKHLVLISSEESINAIAGVAGMYIARSLTSKPEIPSTPKRNLGTTTIAAEEIEPINTAQANSTVPLAPEKNIVSASEKSSKSLEEDVITMDAVEPSGVVEKSFVDDGAAQEKTKRKKRAVKIPDFTSFRTKLVITGIIGTLLIGGWVYGFVIAPRAVVTINVNTSKTTVSYQFTASVAAESLDSEKRVVPAKLAEVTKESNAKVEATGQKNVGAKATGSVAFTAKVCAPNLGSIPEDLEAGSTIASGGKNFIMQEGVEFSFKNIGGSCANYETDTVSIVAGEAGSGYNITNANFTANGRQEVAGSGTASGGTDQTVKVVSAEDIKNATAQLKGSTSAEASSDLKAQLEAEGLMVLEQTLEEGQPTVKNSPAEGAEASEVTVTQTVVYKMIGVKSDDLKSILSAQLAKQLESQQSTKSVRDDGFSSSALRVINKVTTGEQIIELQTIASLGEKFDLAAVAQQSAGKPRGEIQKTFESREGVNSVDVSYSPAWVTTTPKGADKIRVEIKEIEN